MEKNLKLAILCSVLVSSCGTDAPQNLRTVRISEAENICASAPGILMRSTDSGADFDIGILATDSGEEIDYYVGSEPIQLRDLRMISDTAGEKSRAGISWHVEKYTSGTEAVAVKGYSNSVGEPTLTVRYWFSASDRRERVLANALAATTGKCVNTPN